MKVLDADLWPIDTPKPLQALRQQPLQLQAFVRSKTAAASTLSSNIPCEQLPPTGSRATLGVIPTAVDMPVRCRLWILKSSISLNWPSYSVVPNAP